MVYLERWRGATLQATRLPAVRSGSVGFDHVRQRVRSTAKREVECSFCAAQHNTQKPKDNIQILTCMWARQRTRKCGSEDVVAEMEAWPQRQRRRDDGVSHGLRRSEWNPIERVTENRFTRNKSTETTRLGFYLIWEIFIYRQILWKFQLFDRKIGSM